MNNRRFGTTNTELENYMSKHPPTKKFGRFLGVFPSDKLPPVKKPCCLIANYDEFGMGGSHWIAMAFPTNEAPQYFDSYGRDAEFWENLLGLDVDFKTYLRENSKNHSYIYNKVDFQNIKSNQRQNDTCGEYCCYFLMNGSPSNMGGANPAWIRIRKIPQPERNIFIRKIVKVRN